MIAQACAHLNALRVWGVREYVKKLYMMGSLKFGELRGVDKFGNRYLENAEAYPWGQHRWVEYADPHNFDASMIPPEWHGWMHHTFDTTPDELPLDQLPHKAILTESHAPYKSYVGSVVRPAELMHNKSTWRQRGYMIGSLYTEPGEKDHYYTQPGHPLNPKAHKGGRFNNEMRGVATEMDDHDALEPVRDLGLK